MQVNPYLFFNGNCEAALKFYQKVLGAKIEAMLPYSTGPADMPMPPDWKDKVLHASILIDGEVIMASDASPGDFHQPQGFAVALQVEDPADAERRFKALAEGGFELADVVRAHYYITDAAYVDRVFPILGAYFGDIRPAATMITCGLNTPEMKIEIEVTALKRTASGKG